MYATVKSSDSEPLTSLRFPDDLLHLLLLRENWLQTHLSFVLHAVEGVPQAQTCTGEHFSFAVRQLLAEHGPFVDTHVTSSVTLVELGCFQNVFGNVRNTEDTRTFPSCLRVIEGLPSKKKGVSETAHNETFCYVGKKKKKTHKKKTTTKKPRSEDSDSL